MRMSDERTGGCSGCSPRTTRCGPSPPWSSASPTGCQPKALARLAAGGLAVQEEDGKWRAAPEKFRELLRARAAEPDPR